MFNKQHQLLSKRTTKAWLAARLHVQAIGVRIEAQAVRHQADAQSKASRLSTIDCECRSLLGLRAPCHLGKASVRYTGVCPKGEDDIAGNAGRLPCAPTLGLGAKAS